MHSCRLVSVVVALLATRCMVKTDTDRNKSVSGESMFFSPYLNASIGQAVNKSKVEIFKDIANVDAYSGYISLSAQSHLFFLLTKAPEEFRRWLGEGDSTVMKCWEGKSHKNYLCDKTGCQLYDGDRCVLKNKNLVVSLRNNNIRDSSPLLLWLSGGPGKSSMFAQFLENGPVGINVTGGLFKRSETLQKYASVIYLDQPAGAGLSIIQNYTDPRNYAHTLEDMSEMIEKFMKQFLIFFPEYIGRSFYIAGESYGARAALGFGERMRCTPPENKTNLTLNGLILGSGFLAPIVDLMDSTEFLYQTGLLNDTGRTIFNKTFAQIRELSTFNTTLALYLLISTVLNLGSGGEKSLFQNLTGFTAQGSALYSIMPPEVEAYVNYTRTRKFKESLHVPLELQIDSLRPMVALMLSQDFFTDITAKLINALEYQNILLFTGQVDTLFPSMNFRKYFSTLQWNKKEEFKQAGRNTWSTCRDSRRVAGYIESIANFSYAVVLRAGHHTTLDEPSSVHHLMSSFIKGGNFENTLNCIQSQPVNK